MRYSNDLSYKGYESAILPTYFRVTKSEIQVLIIMRLQAYYQKVTKSGKSLLMLKDCSFLLLPIRRLPYCKSLDVGARRWLAAEKLLESCALHTS